MDKFSGNYAGPMVKPEIRTADKSFLVFSPMIFRAEAVALFRHQIHPEPAHNDYRDPKKRNRDGAIGGQCRPETPAVPQHPGEDQKHRQGGEDEPKRALRVIGKSLRRLAVVVHPDHGQERGDRQGDEHGGKPVVHQLNFGDQHDDSRADEKFAKIKWGETEDFIPRNAAHK